MVLALCRSRLLAARFACSDRDRAGARIAVVAACAVIVVDPHDRDLCRARPEPVRRATGCKHAQAGRLGRPRHRRRAHALPRPTDQRHEPDLAARVLEPLDRQGLEPRRHRAGTDALTRPRRSGRHSQPRPGRQLGCDGKRRRGGRRADRRAARRHDALPRQAAGSFSVRAERCVDGRVDGRARELLAVRAG